MYLLLCLFSSAMEWYTYDKSPRPNVRVLASVDEATYTPASDIKMGDQDRKSTRLNSSHSAKSRMPSSA